MYVAVVNNVKRKEGMFTKKRLEKSCVHARRNMSSTNGSQYVDMRDIRSLSSAWGYFVKQSTDNLSIIGDLKPSWPI